MNARVSVQRFSACARVCLVLAGLGWAGCQQTPTVRPADAPRVSVAARPARIPFWNTTGGEVRVENTLSRPIAILSVELRAGNSVVARDGGETVLAEVTDDGATIDGTLMVEDIGAAARLPSPDRWQWKGTGKLVHFPVLRSGQTVAIAGSFRVTDKTGNRLSASLHYAELTDDVGLLFLAEQRHKPIPAPPGGTFGKGWVPTRRMAVVFRKADQIAESAHLRARRGDSALVGPRMSCYPHALPKDGFDALSKSTGKLVGADGTFEVVGPPVALRRAREIVRVTAGPYTYFPPRSAWVIEGDGVTHFVGKASKATHPGRLVDLAEELTTRQRAELELFTRAKSKDPGGHVAFLIDKGFEAKTELQKGQTYRGRVLVKRSDLDKFLETLSKRGLRVEGLAVR